MMSEMRKDQIGGHVMTDNLHSAADLSNGHSQGKVILTADL